MNKNNTIYHIIIIYIFVVISLVLIKPEFIYNHVTNEYKKFGYTDDKTKISIQMITLGLPIIMVVIFSLFGKNNETKQFTNGVIQYIPVFQPI